MRIGLATRAMNGPESRALRTGLHLERRNLARIINALGVLGGARCQNDDILAWEVGEEGYPHAITRLLVAIDHAVSRLAADLYEESSPEGEACEIVRPKTADMPDLFPLEAFGVILDNHSKLVMLGEGGDIWQRLFDAVVCRLADMCERQGLKLTIGLPTS